MSTQQVVSRIALMLMMGLLVGNSLAFAQTTDQESTPNATNDAPVFPEFFIEAVGDFPEGFFRDVTIEPGSSVELTVAVVNSGTIPVDLRVSRINAITSINGGFYAGEEADDPDPVTSWMDLDPVDVSLQPGEEHFETFEVSVPADISPGQYMSGLLARTSNPIGVPGSDILDQTIQYAISVSILVPGEISGAFELGDPSVTAAENNRRVVVPIENTGNYLVKPVGEFVLSDQSGIPVHQTTLALGSIYTGANTEIWLQIPQQMTGGRYQMNLELTDPESGVSDSIVEVEVTIPNPAAGSGVSVGSVDIAANDAEIVFANVEILLINGGPQIAATNVTLIIALDGEQIDEFPLATNQVMLAEDNVYTTRYIPPQVWESGTYTFHIVVESVDPASGQGTLLLEEDLFTEIVVP